MIGADLAFPTAPRDRDTTVARQQRHHQVLEDRPDRHDAVAGAVARHVGDRAAHHGPRALGNSSGCPSMRTVPLRIRNGAEQCAQQIRLPLTMQTAQPENFASPAAGRTHRRACPKSDTRPRASPRRRRVAPSARRLGRRPRRPCRRPPRHASFAREGRVSTVSAVAHDRDAVGDLEHFVHAMGDEYDRAPLRLEGANTRKHRIDLIAIQRRRRFVEDDDTRDWRRGP